MTPGPPRPAPGAGFATTRWSLVRRAGGGGPEAAEALERLCGAYWPAAYAFARRWGRSPDDALDSTQAFFARVLEGGDLWAAAPERGRFRSFLLACLRHHLANEDRGARALRRGGGTAPLPLLAEGPEGAVALELAGGGTPDEVFERRWARSVLEEALAALDREYREAGQAEVFDCLRPVLTGEESAPYAEWGRRLGRTEGAVKVAAHRLRRRFGEALRRQVLETVGRVEEVDEEVRLLLDALARPGPGAGES